MSDLIQRFLAELKKRKIPLKRAAQQGDLAVSRIRRLSRGETDQLSADAVRRIAMQCDDPAAFLSKVFAIDLRGKGRSPSVAAPAPVRGLVEPPGKFDGRYWVVEDGQTVPAIMGFPQTIAVLTNTNFAVPEEALHFAFRCNGWASWSAQHGLAEIHYDRRAIIPTVAAKISDMIRMSRDIVRYRIADGGPNVGLYTPEEAILRLGRRIRAGRPVPGSWLDVAVPFGETHERLRALVASYERGMNRPADLMPLLESGLASLYSIVPDDGEAICLQIGKRWNVPTHIDVGLRVLDRKDNLVYAAMIERHIGDVVRRAKPAVTRLGVDFGRGRRVVYDRLALPFRMSDVDYVLTTSHVISDTATSQPNPLPQGGRA